MKIIVAGAGAGKTTSMAQLVLDRFNNIAVGKIIYVITYTNAARDRIREKIIELNGNIPKRILIETSHAFLLREFIFPFYHLLYEQQFTKVSQIKLSENNGFKAMKIKELAGNKTMHVERVTETAKWIVCKKSSDTKRIKEKREKILAIVSRYLDSVFMDEAQDMDKHFVEIIKSLNSRDINICIVGDPKQDLRGRNAFKEMIDMNNQKVEYISVNHRCPISHIQLANTYIAEKEHQLPQNAEVGVLNYAFECDVNINAFVDAADWDYVFIYKKNERFITNADDQHKTEQNLSYEIKSLVRKSGIKESKIDPVTYILNKEILKVIQERTDSAIFKRLSELLSIKLTRQDMGKLGEALKLNRKNNQDEGILVKSIDKVKGLEGERCLFILTTDLAPYLFGEKKEQNKMLNYLYVALTRSKKELNILISNEVQEMYGDKRIIENFNALLIERSKTETIKL